MKAILRADGGARGNPGPAGIGVVLEDLDGNAIGEIARGIGVATNNVAEYTALIEGLKLAQAKGVTEIDVRMDSKLIVNQVLGEWKIKNDALRQLAARAERLLRTFERKSLTYVPREQNAAADKLANQGMDAAALDDELDRESKIQHDPLF
ncbi:MAG TPA: reverse transcriptase-like protein [Actinomycetota bacterium]|nr:reverse transcriptase-like protein [Actinomycetota bacterium]